MQQQQPWERMLSTKTTYLTGQEVKIPNSSNQAESQIRQESQKQQKCSVFCSPTHLPIRVDVTVRQSHFEASVLKPVWSDPSHNPQQGGTRPVSPPIDLRGIQDSAGAGPD